jgi:hypothetical protein
VFQPIIQFFLSLNGQLIVMHDAIVTWMVNFSSVTSHLMVNFVQTYLYGLFSGLPAATPRHVTAARSQWIRFFRSMAQPALYRVRNGRNNEKSGSSVKSAYKKKRRK